MVLAVRMDPAVVEVARQMARALREQAAGLRVRGVEVELGALVELGPEELRAALEAELPGVDVHIRTVDGILRCLDCGATYPSDEHPCPVCGSNRAELIHGQELGIVRAWGEREG